MRRPPAELVAIAIILGITAISALSVAALARHRSTAARPTAVANEVAPSPTAIAAIIPGPLNGLPTARKAALRRPVAVVIDNYSPDARPQSGLRAASVVYESLAEGGITRLLAVFLEHDALPVGPIRSARPYFVEWAAGYRALLVHAGGAPAALQLLFRTPGIGNIEALAPLPQFYRSPNRPGPHNLFGSTAGARFIARRNHWRLTGQFPWMLHKRPASPSKRGTRQSISVSFSTPSIASPPEYNVTFRYRPAANVYARYVGGRPAVDLNTGRQIAPGNVIVLFARISPIPGDPEQRVAIGAVGRGQALYFRDGHSLRGFWTKASVSGRLRFWNNRKQRVGFDPGQTWIEIAAPGSVRFSPHG